MREAGAQALVIMSAPDFFRDAAVQLEAIEVFPLGGADRPWREVFIEHFEVDVWPASEPQSLWGEAPASITQGLTKPLAISPQPSTSQPSARRSPRLIWAELD